MPRARKVVEGIPTPPPESCGHINLHALDALGKHPVCFLPKGHEGNHRGKFMDRDVTRKYNGKTLISKTHVDVVRETEWADGAGEMPKPAFDPPPALMAETEFGGNAKDVLSGS